MPVHRIKIIIIILGILSFIIVFIAPDGYHIGLGFFFKILIYLHYLNASPHFVQNFSVSTLLFPQFGQNIPVFDF